MTRKVKAQLALLDLKLEDLAEECGVSKPLISMILSDKYVGHEHRPKILRRLKLKSSDVWPESDDNGNGKRRAA